MEAFGRPVVSLEAGLSSDNPPCPACAEPLFGWALLRPNDTPVRSCELCGMAVAGDIATPEEARETLVEAAASGKSLPNRRSLQASIGNSGWALLERDSRFAFTPEATGRLGFDSGRPRPAVLGMWQTLINSFTFGHDIMLGRLRIAKPTPASGPVRRMLDVAISILTAIPLLALAVVVESLAWIMGRGGKLTVEPSADLGEPQS